MKFACCSLGVILLLSCPLDAQPPNRVKRQQQLIQQRNQQQKRLEAERKREEARLRREAEKARNNRIAKTNDREIPEVDLAIAPVDPARMPEVLASAARIDHLVEAKIAAAGLQSNPPSTDEQFVRRIYLDIGGTIPRGRQAYSFLSSDQTGKRSVLINHLLNQPGYASHLFNEWADIFRVIDRGNGQLYLRPFSDWLKKSFRENRPWDEMVREMLTASGKPWENPAVGYKLRDDGMPLDNLNNTVRIFLGTRIGCAQCHDHPFDRWTQKEFYQLAAFEGGVLTRAPRKGPVGFEVKNLDAAVAQVEGQLKNRVRQMRNLNSRQVVELAYRKLKYPHDYAYDDAKPGQVVEPQVIFGENPPAKGKSRRQALADWITSSDNPRFALTIANRMWKRAMGVGLIEPVDDMRDDTEASNPELMKFLVAEMKRLDFNLKEFMRILYHTRTYQRQVSYGGYDPTQPYHFPGPVLRRMTAEQVWDSLLTLAIKSPDSFLRASDKQFIAAANVTADTPAETLVAKVAQLDEARKAERKEEFSLAYKGAVLRRASELRQPLPAEHFLRQFGQSDRQLIASGTTDGNVPQLLALFNGPVTHMMLEAGSVIHTEVTTADGVGNRIRIIFLSILGRMPDATEMTVASSEIRTEGPAGYGNVIWSLLNTREFLFVQ